MAIYSNISSGGAKTGGTNTQIYFDHRRGTGGSRTGGKSFVSKIKYEFLRTFSGIDECIKENSQEPTAILPSIEFNPRQEITGVWCPVSQKCQGSLPKIIVTRQKGHVPNPNGTVGPADRGFATFAPNNDVVIAQAIVGGKIHRADPRRQSNKEIKEAELPKNIKKSCNKKHRRKTI